MGICYQKMQPIMFENMKEVTNIFYPFVECYNLWNKGLKKKITNFYEAS